MRVLLFLTLSAVSLLAKDVVVSQKCEAYNDLKHHRNSGNVLLKKGDRYHFIREQKGNYYITIEGVSPKSRWVSKECFTTLQEGAKGTTREQKSSLDSLLVLSWHNAFCETHSNKRECKRDGGEAKNHLVLHGLWPQPRSNVYCGVPAQIVALDKAKRWNALPKLNLKPEVVTLMQKYMPGFKSNLQRHEYYKHGSCYSKDPNRYFLDALQLTKRVDETVGEYLRVNIGKRVKEINIKRVAMRLIDEKIKNKIAIKCKRAILNEVWISLKGKGSNLKELIKGAKGIHSNCKDAIVDAPGKFRRF